MIILDLRQLLFLSEPLLAGRLDLRGGAFDVPADEFEGLCPLLEILLGLRDFLVDRPEFAHELLPVRVGLFPFLFEEFGALGFPVHLAVQAGELGFEGEELFLAVLLQS